MKILITGGAGFIGFHLAKYLSEKNQVHILDNFARGKDDEDFKAIIDNKNVKFLKKDITLKKTFDELDKDYDRVYHLAAINGTENFYKIPDKVLKVGVIGTLNLLDWFKDLKDSRLLFSSSSETYAGALKLLKERFPIPTPENVPLVVDDPTNVRWSYGAGKIIGEVAIHSYAKAYNFKNFAIIRYHNIYGPRMGFEHVIPQFIERVLKKEPKFDIFGGDETRTFCYVDDAVKATEIVMEKVSGDTVHIGRSDDEIKITELAEKIFDIVNHHPEFNRKPGPQGSVMRRCPDTTKLNNLGFTAKINLDEGLKKTFEWYKDKFK